MLGQDGGDPVRRLVSLTRTPQVAADPLTAREREIAALIERGLSNKEIAQRLNIEVATVKNHVHSILGKLNVGSRGAVAASRRDRGPSRARRVRCYPCSAENRSVKLRVRARRGSHSSRLWRTR